jgi:hypothetical protein
LALRRKHHGLRSDEEACSNFEIPAGGEEQEEEEEEDEEEDEDEEEEEDEHEHQHKDEGKEPRNEIYGEGFPV